MNFNFKIDLRSKYGSIPHNTKKLLRSLMDVLKWKIKGVFGQQRPIIRLESI